MLAPSAGELRWLCGTPSQQDAKRRSRRPGDYAARRGRLLPRKAVSARNHCSRGDGIRRAKEDGNPYVFFQIG